jgi:hypothetical protein
MHSLVQPARREGGKKAVLFDELVKLPASLTKAERMGI